MDGRIKERMTWVSSSQKSVYFGITPLSLSTMNSHSITHVQPIGEIMCSTVHDLPSLFQTSPLLSNKSDLSLGDATSFNQLVYLCILFTC